MSVKNEDGLAKRIGSTSRRAAYQVCARRRFRLFFRGKGISGGVQFTEVVHWYLVSRDFQLGSTAVFRISWTWTWTWTEVLAQSYQKFYQKSWMCSPVLLDRRSS